MAKRMRPQRPAGSAVMPVRSVRVSDKVWDTALKRARREQVTMSHVIAAFIEGYGSGQLDLPRLQLVYPSEPLAEMVYPNAYRADSPLLD